MPPVRDSPCIRIPEGHSTACGVGDFHQCTIGAFALSAQVAGCVDGRRMTGTRRAPTSEWVRDVARKTDSDELDWCFRDTTRIQLARLPEILQYGGPPDVATGMHLIARYDKT